MKLFRDDRYDPLHQGYAVYQQIVAAYRCKSSRQGKQMMTALIKQLPTPTAIKELDQSAQTLHHHRNDILAHFDREISHGPVEAINGRLEHLRGIALGFRNLSRYILRSLLHAGQITHKTKMPP